jgi:hypothetical protein
MDGNGTRLHIVEVVTALSLCHPVAGAPRTDMSGLADSPEMYDRLVISTQRGHQARELEKIRIHIQ